MSNVAFAYVRVSTEEQYKSTLGIRGYIESIIRYAETKGLDLGKPCKVAIGDHVFEARERIVIEHASAFKVRFFDRKGAKMLLRSWQTGDHLIVATWDRLSRSFRDGVSTMYSLKDMGIKVHVVDFGGMDVDLTSEMGMVFLAFYAAFAERFSRRLSESVKAAKRQARIAGRPAEHTPPIGFKWEGHGKQRVMVVDPKQMAVLRQMQEWMAQKKGCGSIYSELLRLGIRVPYRCDWVKAKYGDEWTRALIYKYLNAAKRMGGILRDTELVPEDGKEWLDEYHKRAEEKALVKADKQQKRRAEVARNRLKEYI